MAGERPPLDRPSRLRRYRAGTAASATQTGPRANDVFQRGHDESLRLVARLKEILAKYPS